MMLAMGFHTLPLLIGLLAAAIPLLLHLLSSVKAREVYFPTLRFLRLSMEKTARRRRIQNWLLLMLRSILLGLLAIAVAEPFSDATGGWLGGNNYAAVVILDNSFSMSARGESGARFSRAKTQASALLGGENKPALAALITTNGPQVPKEMTAALDGLREEIDKTQISFSRSFLSQRVAAAVELLEKQAASQKSIYLFSDMQRVSFRELTSLKELAQADDIHLMIVDTSAGKTGNVAVTDVEISGQRLVNQVLKITATVVNSSDTDRVVDVVLSVEGQDTTQRFHKSLRAAGMDGSIATVRFYQRVTRPGPIHGRVFLDIHENDDLPLDNVRRFSMTIAGKARALVVAGPARATDDPGLAPAAKLQIALNPFPDGAAPWSIISRTVKAGRFSASNLDDTDAVFFCNVPSFTAAQAKGIVKFVRQGGTAVFFPGNNTDAKNYNLRFINETGSLPMMPGQLANAIGQVGPAADAIPVDWVDMDYPYLAGLYKNLDDYLGVLVQRYFTLDRATHPGKVLIRLANGAPLLLERRFDRGRCILCTTTASAKWSSLPLSGMFLPAVTRMTLLASRDSGRDNTCQSGEQIVIRPNPSVPEGTDILVTPPGGKPLTITTQGRQATFAKTSRVGLYRWKIGGKKTQAGQFVVNPHGEESKLDPLDAATLTKAMADNDIHRVYVAADLESANRLALADAKGQDWWDVLLAGVIILLVVEALAANRRSGERQMLNVK